MKISNFQEFFCGIMLKEQDIFNQNIKKTEIQLTVWDKL